MKKNHFLSAALFMVCVAQVFGQGREVSGTVSTSNDSLPLYMVSIVLKGTTLGTASDQDGAFALRIPEHYDAYDTLCFSSIGMKSQEVEMSRGCGGPLQVCMEADMLPMAEVTIVYDTLTRETRTYLSEYRPDTVIHVLVQVIDSLQSAERLRNLRYKTRIPERITASPSK